MTNIAFPMNLTEQIAAIEGVAKFADRTIRFDEVLGRYETYREAREG